MYNEEEGGWCEGRITYYNKNLDKLRVGYDDDSEDFISPRDIDGIEIVLCVD